MLKALLYFLFFFIPTQLGRHFWFDWSYKLGMRVDYLAPTIYFTDILVLLVIFLFFTPGVGKFLSPQGCWVKEKFPPQGYWAAKIALLRGQPQELSLRLLLCCFIGLLMVGWWLFVVGENPYLLIYNLGRLGLLGLLGYVIAKTFKKEDFPRIIKVLNWALILQVSLGVYQVVIERSADLWILGERSFSIITPGIARFLAPGGQLLLRGYGTFPHPNVLGGFCLLMLVGNTVLFLKRFTPGIRKFQISNLKSQINSNFQNLNDQKNVIFYIVGFGFSLLGIWLSMSVLAIVLSQVFLMGIGAWIFGCRTIPRLILLAFPILIVLFLFSIFNFQFSIFNESISRRIVLLQYSWEMFKTSPVFGVGLGNFVPAMPEKPVGSTYFWQPVHNVFALIVVETGLAGLAIAGWLFLKLSQNIKNQILNVKNALRPRSGQARQKLKKLNYQLLIIIGWWGTILITGLFDHYWLTLQQGRLMLVMVTGLTFVGASSSKKAER